MDRIRPLNSCETTSLFRAKAFENVRQFGEEFLQSFLNIKDYYMPTTIQSNNYL